MHLEEKIKGEVAIVTLRGDLLDEEDKALLEQKIVSLTADNMRKIVFDVTKLNRVNSQGLAALISVVKSVRNTGGDIRIAGLGHNLNNIFTITRLARVFDTYETTGRALASYTH